MGRAPCCDKANVKKGPWSPEEDAKLKSYIEQHGTGGNWIALPQKIGLKRCGKSCRLRWLNYLRPNIKHGGFSEEEDRIICSLYVSIGSRWSIIAAQLPGRTDNDIKNYWNTRLKKKLFGKQRKEQQATRRGNALKQQMQQMKRSESNNTTHVAENNSTIFSLNDAHNNTIPYWPQFPMAPHFNTIASSEHTNPNENNLAKFGAQFTEESLYNSPNGYGNFLPIIEGQGQGQSSSQIGDHQLENYNNNNMGFDDPRRVLCSGLEFLYGDQIHGCEMGSLISSSCPSNYEAMLQDLSTTQEFSANFSMS